MFEIRRAMAADIPRLMALDHSSRSDYVWQVDLRREAGQILAGFREVRLPRSVEIAYPRAPVSLADDWTRRDAVFVATSASMPVGYVCAEEDHSSGVAWVVDLVMAIEERRKGGGAALLSATQAWALERGLRRLILETQSKNQPGIRLAQKLGYEFCGYNDQYYSTQDVTLFFAKPIK